MDATPERVIAHYALSHAASLDLALSATCRLYAPGGGLVGTVIQDGRLVPVSHEVLDTCQFDLASFQRGDYTLEVVADSPLVSGATSVRGLTADLRVTPAASYTSLLHGAFIRTVDTGAGAGPVVVQNQGDFRYPQVWFSEQLADAGLQWSASATIEPHQSVVVLPPAGTIVPYHRNETSYVYCASREVLTDVATDWLVDVPGGFDVLESGITTIATPKITVGVSPQAVDVCASDSLVFDVLVSAGAYGLGGPLPVLAQAEVPSLGWAQTIAADLSPGSPSASSHHELSLPADIPAGDHEVRIALLQPDVPAFTGHLVFGDRIYDERTFTIRPARMELELAVASAAASGPASLTECGTLRSCVNRAMPDAGAVKRRPAFSRRRGRHRPYEQGRRRTRRGMT